MSLIFKVDTKVPCIFNKVRPGSTFLSVKGYHNNYGEVSNFNIVFHFSYKNAVKRAINTWVKFHSTSKLQTLAKNELIESYSKSLSNGYNWCSDPALREPYAHVVDINGELIDGVKLHIRKKELHLTGLLINKRIISNGNYPVQYKSEFTLAKEELLRMTSLANYRQFKLIEGRFESIHVDQLTITQKDLAQKMM